MSAARTRPEREGEAQARRNAFAGARLMLTDNTISQMDAATRHDSNRHSISVAMLILQHGTEEEINGTEAGTMPMNPTYDAIIARTTPQDRRQKRKPPAQTRALMEAREIDADVWGKLRAALDAITSLPSPKDTAVIVRKNAMRIEHANRKLLVSLQWITEFSDEITR